jgi:radical SAM superfamily enzyme YgiQ (UPF0313 family)
VKILLLSPPYLAEYMRNARCDFVSLSGTQWYPILLGMCGTYLEAKGHTVRLVDAPAAGLDHASTHALITQERPDLLVLYTGYQSEANDIAFADLLVEQLGCRAVIVGPFASIHPAATIGRSRMLHDLVAGEFERGVAALADGAARADVPNLVWREDGTIRHNPPGLALSGAEQDAMPFVSEFFRRQLDLRHYRTPSERYPYIDIMTGRGCAWGRCTYCLWVHTYVKGSVYETRSIENVVEEFRFISRDVPEVRSVMIQDDTFTEERAAAFSEAVIRAGLRLPWSCYSRADLTHSTLQAMKRAHCLNLHVGYETADRDILQHIRKGVSRDRMERFTMDAKRAGLRIHGDFAFGFPGETLASAEQTLRWACKLNPDTAQFQLLIPFPGTPFEAEMRTNGWLNAQGQPNLPGFSNDQIRATAKRAYRKFYLSPRYAKRCLTNPREHLFGRFRTFARAVPAMFWKRWQV